MGGNHSEESDQTGEQQTCNRCGGTGQVHRTVAGRSGVVSCPDCDTIPQSVLPNDPPEDPHARIEELKAEIHDLEEEKEQIGQARRKADGITEDLRELEKLEVVDDETAAVLSHIRGSIARVSHHQFEKHRTGQVIRHKRERIQELELYIDHLEQCHDSS